MAEPKKEPRFKSSKLGWLEWLSGSFMNGVVGNRGDTSKLVDLMVYDDAVLVDTCFAAFDANWREELRLLSDPPSKGESRRRRKPSLRRALWLTFRREILAAAVLKLGWGLMILFSISFFVRQLLTAISVKSGKGSTANLVGHGVDLNALSVGWVLCAFFFLANFLQSMCIQQMSAVSARLGIRMKCVTSSAVYRKALCHDRFQNKTDIVSLVATDCNKLGDSCTTLQYLWSGITEALAIMGVLLGFAGQAALPGCGVMLVVLPIQYVIGVQIARMRRHVTEAADARVMLMDEILQAIKLVKMYAWERKFADSVGVLRAREMFLASIGGLLKSANLVCVFILPPLMGLSIFGVYVLQHDLEGTLAFTTLSLFNTMRLPLIQLPKGLRAVAEAMTAIDRLERFLLAKDRQVKLRSTRTEIVFRKANLAYGFTVVPLLKGIDLHIPKGTLAMVAGPVGCGKSNLLQAIMGQMNMLSGEESIGGSFAYVPQTPWCAHGSVRENILFGRPWDEARYRRILWACALEADLAIMEEGDATQIGERGMNLSGGQKQRIALARAAYSGADTFLLDAPLSAVDMYTCQHIFRHCIQGILLQQEATVVLVTHQVELFKDADLLVFVQRGEIKYAGPFDVDTVKAFFPNSAATSITHDSATLLDQATQRAAPEEHAPPPAVPPSPAGAQKAAEATHESLHPSGPTEQRALALRAELIRRGAGKEGQAASSSDDAGVAKEAPHASPNMSLQLRPALVNGQTARPPRVERQVNGFKALLWEMRPYLVLISLCIYVTAQLARIYSDIWISRWVANATPGRKAQEWYVGVYGGYVGMFFVLLICRGTFFYWMALRASTRLHADMFASILSAPMAFFTNTPLGHILSTFSSDMDQVDEALLDEMHMVVIDVCILGTTVGVVIRVVPIFAAVAGGLTFSFFYFFWLYLCASYGLKIEVGRQSAAVAASVSETLQGLDVILAYGAEERFLEGNIALMDKASMASYNMEMLQLWLSFRLDLIGCFLVLATCLLSLGLPGIPAAGAGLAVSNSFQILLFFSLMVKRASDINANIASVERVAKLGRIEPEIDLPLAHDTCPPAVWPSMGEVNFHGVVMSYAPNLPHVLKGVSFNIQKSEKIGVVGRTGAGKSSLIMAIFRLAELAEGAVRIDGMAIKQLNLSELRRRIAIIPQEPVMFRGTVRNNLDPFKEKADEELQAALRSCLLHSLAESPEMLQTMVAHMGENFSLGERQLICLARAMLNPSKLLLLDEATAALDSDTDAAVQRVIRANFADRTILTIAHRLETVIDSDRILVMDSGRVAEFDTPYALLSRPSIFAQLCRQTGGQYEALQAAAERQREAMLALTATVVSQDITRENWENRDYIDPQVEHLLL